MAISSIGVGSGLPLADLLSSLRSSQEQMTLVPLEARQKKADSRVSGYGQIKVEVEKLAAAAKALGTTAFSTLKTTVTGEDFTASAKNGAAEVSYDIKVTSLARAQSLVSSGVEKKTDPIGEDGVIEFTFEGGTKTLDLTGKSTSLADIAKAINADSELGLQASVINNGSDTPFQLMITSKKTGEKAAVTKIEVQGNTDLNDVLKFGVAGSTVTESAASNAHLTVNGVPITAQSNVVEGALDGVTLTLTSVSGKDNKLQIAQDTDAITKAVETFVNTYNDVHKKIKQLTNYDVSTQTGAALVGDSTPRTIQTRLASILNTTTEGTFNMLSDIGIRTQEGGLLGLDKSKLSEAISKDAKGVENLFKAADGISARTQEITKGFTDAKGLLASVTEGAQKQVSLLKDQYERAEARIDSLMEVYRKQFTAMDSLVSQMNSTSSYLAQQLANLGTKK